MSEAATPTENTQSAAPVNPPADTVYQVPHSAFAELKETARTKGREEGRAEAEAALLAQLKSAGIEVSSITELPAKLKGVQAPPKVEEDKTTKPKVDEPKGETDKQEPKAGNLVQKVIKTERELAAERTRREAAEQAAANAKREAEERVAEAQARTELTLSAARVGVQDTDYAMVLLNRHAAKLSAEELAKFDHKAFFEGLKDTHPALFGTAPGKITTGPAGGPPAKESSNDAPVNVLNMTKAQYKAWREQRGLSN